MFGISLVAIFSIVCVRQCFCELYSSADGVGTLLTTQSDVVKSLEQTLRELETLIYNLQHTVSVFREHVGKAAEDRDGYIGNPINAFTLIMRLTREYEKVNIDTHHSFEKMNLLVSKKAGFDYPTIEDVVGSIDALMRLSLTYKLDHRNISEGRIYDDQSIPLSSNECYTVAVELLKVEDYEYAYIWMEEAVRKFDSHSNFTLVDAYLGLAECETLFGNLKNALFWYYHILDIDPTNEVALVKKDVILKKKNENGGSWKTEPEVEVVHEEGYAKFDNVTYEALCREEYLPDAETYNRLVCFYKFGPSTFLQIAPIKMEEVHPIISLYLIHDVISDDEIEWVKEFAKPRLQRATVVNKVTGENEPSFHRTAQTTWLSQTKHTTVAKIYRRLKDFTDLETENAEPFQIGNYGIGGHYGPHYDFSMKSAEHEKPPGVNRVATVMFYLSDVEMGGGTVFTSLGVTVPPKKGSAVFWINLHPSGEGNMLTSHGACPVLKGSKWVGNVWIQLLDQMHTFPCNQEYQDEEEITHTILKPPRRRENHLRE